MTLRAHPLADAFEMIEGDERDRFTADIGSNGLRERIIMLDGDILDGRNRYRALLDLGLVSPDDSPETNPDLYLTYFRRFVPVQDGSPRDFVISHNVHRRHQSTSQRAQALAELETFDHGGNRRIAKSQDANLHLDRQHLADVGGVSVRSIASAAKVRDDGVPELKAAVKSGKVAVSAAAEIADLPVGEQLGLLQNRDPKAFRQALRDLKANRVGDNRVVMNSRVQPPDDLDYSPTPPWATRALLQVVLPHLGVSLTGMTVLDPACGEGHMSGVLEEAKPAAVWASDIWDYSVDGVSPPGWVGTRDYLADDEPSDGIDWVVMNSPFKDKAEKFAHKALGEAQVGVAMFVRLGWLASKGRFDRLFSVNPPTLIAIFAEDVPLHMGRWEPDGVTMSDYIWLIWVKDVAPQAPFWIPPGQRSALTLPDDVERFTAHPVRGRPKPIQPETANEAPMAVGGDSAEVATAPLSESVDILPGGILVETLDGADQPPADHIHMPDAPPASVVADGFAHDIFVGGMRDNAVGTFRVDAREGGFFPALSYMLLGAPVSGGFRAHEGARTAKLAAGAAMSELLRRFEHIAGRTDSHILDRHRAAMRGGMAWLRLRAEQWGVTLDDDVMVAAGTHATSERIAMSFEEATPILRERYATSSGAELEVLIGRPIGTIRTWAYKLDLTSKARIAGRGAAMVEQFNAKREKVT